VINPLALVTVALGNRISGAKEGSHALGAAVMAYGSILQYPALCTYYPLIFLTLLLFRAPATGPNWLANTRGEHVNDGMLRGSWILPYCVLLTYLTHDYTHMFLGLLFPVISLIYILAGKQKKVEPVALAECITGLAVGVV